MRSDMVPGTVFPDYELSDHTGKHRKLSELQGPNPWREGSSQTSRQRSATRTGTRVPPPGSAKVAAVG